MAFRHGVYKSEVPTSLLAPAQGESGLPVIIGSSPVFMSKSDNVNKPVLCYTYEEAVSKFGYSDDWENYTLCEFIYSQFALYGQAPCVLINVFDPAKHSTVTTVNEGQEYESDGQKVYLGPDVISADDYELYYDDSGDAWIESESSVKIKKLKRANPGAVTDADIIGGVNQATGKMTGLELINEVFPRFRLVPGLIGAPKFSEHPAVAAVMRAKAELINGLFTACAVVDIPSDNGGANVYTKAPEWKNRNNYVAEHMIACWPKVKLGGKVFHLSTQLIGLMNKVDRAHRDIPFKSPSNELLQMDSCVNSGGEEVMLGHEQANYLNGQGIVCPLNWIGGWRAWGNRTGAYPASTDAKDVFIPVRRMMDYLGNQFILTFWQKVDAPMTPRLIRMIVNSFNVYLNSLVAIEALLGGRVEFRESENALTDLLNGILKFHIYVTPPLPAEVIEGIFEFDPQYLTTLYDALK